MTTRRPGPLARKLLRAPAVLYDRNLGWLLGGRVLRLTHLGRKSGRTYRTVLEVVGRNAAAGEVLVVAGFGRTSDWFRNIQTAPAVEVAVGSRRFRPEFRVLEEDEATAVLGDYERRNRVIAPIVRKMLGWLVGWPYDGSVAARRRLVRELPIVAFRPAGSLP